MKSEIDSIIHSSVPAVIALFLVGATINSVIGINLNSPLIVVAQQQPPQTNFTSTEEQQQREEGFLLKLIM